LPEQAGEVFTELTTEDSSDLEPDLSAGPYPQESVIAENNNLKVTLVRESFKRRIKYAIEDHQFILHIEQKTKTPVLLSSITDILRNTFFSILTHLKSTVHVS
jgi:hypothetical protein